MEVARRRTATRKGVVAGSVWESRMKMDEVKGGIKVFNGEENSEEGCSGVGELRVYRRLKQNQNGVVKGKRKTWKSESVEEPEKSPILTRKPRSESHKFSDESFKELSTSVDGIEKTPIQIRKTRSESIRVSDELGVSVDGIERTPIQIRKSRSDSHRIPDEEACKEIGVSVDGIERNPIQRRNTISDSHRIPDEVCKELEVTVDGIEKTPIQIKQTRFDSHCVPDETCKEFGVYKQKIISSSVNNGGLVESPGGLVMDDDDEEDEEEEEDEDEDEEEIEKKSFDVKEINIPEQKPEEIVNEERKLHQIHEKPKPISANVNEEKKLQQIPEKPIPISTNLNTEKKLRQIPEKPIPISANLNRKPRPVTEIAKKKPSPVIDHRFINRNLTNPPPIAVSEEFGRIPVTQNNLQNIVDLVMWRNVSKSAFVFGLGTFILISSSYTKDINFSLISAISYMGLLYLAAIFVYRSILCRGEMDLDDSSHIYMVGEEEAIWFLKLVLPYLNEFLLRIRGLFSGDPGTTLKLAVVLFVLARCGSSITIWKMVKLGFFGVFTVPKVCSSYSTHDRNRSIKNIYMIISSNAEWVLPEGKFWVRRFRDAWESCTHKKAVAFGIFTLVWNLSSVVARIWAVFVLVVAVRYYQQSEDWEEEEDSRGQRQERGPTLTEAVKERRKNPKKEW
ncbi:hypothetical protein HHK36_021279 [Tetracentron sinense]|uniref:Reticulon-like protein n=1 Tax=Tetracentron sinense TaxID=13715 RepID=A0A834YUR2_TETSI|nr:hypothetical protein HHK36_021279 [Tetracentron sinense]